MALKVIKTKHHMKKKMDELIHESQVLIRLYEFDQEVSKS